MGRERKDPHHPRWKAIDDLYARGLGVPPRLYVCDNPVRVKIYYERALKGDTSSLSRGPHGGTATADSLKKYTRREKSSVADIYASRRKSAMRIPMGKTHGLSPEAIWEELRPRDWHPRDWWLLYPGPNKRSWGRVVREALDMSLTELQELRGKSISDLEKGVIGGL